MTLTITSRMVATPVTLSSKDFTPVSSLVDPRDGKPIDAFAAFDFATQDSGTFVTKSGQTGVPADVKILITPSCFVKIGVSLTAPLLAHEQFH